MLPKKDVIKPYLYSTLKIGKALACDFVPGTGTLFAIVEGLYQIQTERMEERLGIFHEKLLHENEIPEEVIDKNFLADDFYKILRHCINDDESQKVELYAVFYAGLISGKVNQRDRVNFIKALSELTYDDIDNLRNVYMKDYEAIKRIPISSKAVYWGQARGTQPLAHSQIEEFSPVKYKLAMHSFLSMQRGCRITPQGVNFIEILFKEEDLIPKRLTETPKKIFAACVLWEKRLDSQLYHNIENILCKYKIKCANGHIDAILGRRSTMGAMRSRFSDLFILLLDGKASEEHEHCIKCLNQFKVLSKCIFIETVQSENKEEGLWKTIPDAQKKIFYIDMDMKEGNYTELKLYLLKAEQDFQAAQL